MTIPQISNEILCPYYLYMYYSMNIYQIGTSTISLCEFFLLRIIPLAGSAVSRSVKLTLEDLAKQVFGISYRSNVIWQVLT